LAEVTPFISCRPARELAGEVAALPYDVFSRAEATAEIEQHPLSFLRIDKSAACLPPEVDEYAPEVYAAAAQTFAADLRRGVFLVDENEPACFAYRLIKGAHSQIGVVACVSAAEYEAGIIKCHESTRAHKQCDRVEHILALGAHTGPVFLAYRQNPAVDALVTRAVAEQPEYDFIAPDAVRHTVWRIAAPEKTEALKRAFAQVDALYIADGHHRAGAAAAVAARLAPSDTHHPAARFLAVLFPANQLQIRDYNRVISGLNGQSLARFLRQVVARFELEAIPAEGRLFTDRNQAPAADKDESPTDKGQSPGSGGQLSTADKGESSSAAYRPGQRGCFGMYVAGRWYRLILDEATRPVDPVASLDVAILHERLLAPVLGITDPRRDSRISYVGGVRGLDELVRRADAQQGVAFALHPCTLEELFAVADAGRLMPPKSTWFEPKPRSGLFIHRI
jgi:uncharacterized protein (DUF1015 family)